MAETFRVGDRLVLVEDIPANVCENCGEPTFSAEVAERLRQLVHGPHRVARTLTAEVLAFEAV